MKGEGSGGIDLSKRLPDVAHQRCARAGAARWHIGLNHGLASRPIGRGRQVVDCFDMGHCAHQAFKLIHCCLVCGRQWPRVARLHDRGGGILGILKGGGKIGRLDAGRTGGQERTDGRAGSHTAQRGESADAHNRNGDPDDHDQVAKADIKAA